MNCDETLILDLPLNDLSGRGMRNRLPSAEEFQVQGAVSVVPDDLFGSCARMASDASIRGQVTLARVFSVEFWVRLEAVPAVSTEMFTLAGVRGGARLVLSCTDTGWTWRFVGGATQTLNVPAAHVAGKWWHLAAIVTEKTLVAYLHDAGGAEADTFQCDIAATDFGDASVVAGFLAGAASLGVVMYGLRIHGSALSKARVVAGLVEDRRALLPFRASHPLEVSFGDEQGQPRLTIEDGEHQRTLTVDLHNASAETIQFGASAGTGSADHDIAIRFRRGVLSSRTLSALRDEPAQAVRPQNEWMLVGAPDEQLHDVTLRLRYAGTQPLLEAGRSIRLYLQNVSAAPGVGVRGTTVELLLGNVSFAGGTRITGRRTQFLHIANAGRSEPFRIAFGSINLASGNRVLNDDVTYNSFVLRLINQSGRAIPLSSIGSSTTAKFRVRFPVGPDASADPEVLTTLDRALEMNVTCNLGDCQRVEPHSPDWQVVPRSGTVLRDGGSLDITVEKVKTGMPPGKTRIFVQHEDVPGYQDGEIACDIERSGLTFAGPNVGIGVGKPEYPLDVAGAVRFSFVGGADLVFGSFNGVPFLHVLRDGDIQPNGLVIYANTVRLTGALQLREGPAVSAIQPAKNEDPTIALATVAFVRELVNEVAQRTLALSQKREALGLNTGDLRRPMGIPKK
jgi:hypothetical protein